MNDPILITGCARSGTSLVAGIIHYCGGFGGAMTGEMGHNPKGQFENWYLRDHVEKPVLSFYGADPMGQKPLPETQDMLPTPLLKEMFYLVMVNAGWVGQRIFYKGAKLCLMWPLWYSSSVTASSVSSPTQPNAACAKDRPLRILILRCVIRNDGVDQPKAQTFHHSLPVFFTPQGRR